jgi:hypothetical protein
MKMSDQTAGKVYYPYLGDDFEGFPFVSKAPDEVPQAVRLQEFVSNTPRETATINAKSDRERIVSALDAETLCCQPGENGFADTTPAVNLVNGSLYHGVYQLLLKDHQKQNGFPTAEYGTCDQFEKAAQSAGKEEAIKKGEPGITLTINDHGKLKYIQLFNIAQAAHPDAVRSYAAQRKRAMREYSKYVHGENYREPEPRVEGPAMSCVSTKPAEYLGQYFAALSMNGSFRVTPRQSAQFAENMRNAVFEKGPDGRVNPFNLNVICNKASEFCRAFMREFPRSQIRIRFEDTVPSVDEFSKTFIREFSRENPPPPSDGTGKRSPWAAERILPLLYPSGRAEGFYFAI